MAAFLNSVHFHSPAGLETETPFAGIEGERPSSVHDLDRGAADSAVPVPAQHALTLISGDRHFSHNRFLLSGSSFSSAFRRGGGSVPPFTLQLGQGDLMNFICPR